MFIVAEVIDGDVYALDESGDIWRLQRESHIHLPKLSRLERKLSRETISQIASPRLQQWACE